MAATAEEFGQAFSDASIAHATRIEMINDIDDKVRALRRSIMDAQAADTEASGLTFVDPDTDEFRGNGTGSQANGINVSVQTAGEALWTEIDGI